MRKLPQYSFNEGFYIWFDINSKEEYYSTPLYMYKTDFDDDLKNYKRKQGTKSKAICRCGEFKIHI